MRYTAAFLQLSSPGGGIIKRWQSRWRSTVTFESQQWEPCPFDWTGIVAGGSAEESKTSLQFPRLASIEAILRQAQREAWGGSLRVYHYAEELDGAAPPASGMQLVGTFRGVLEVSGGNGPPAPRLSAALVSSQSVTNPQFPPRLADTAMIGVPCVVS